MYVIDEVLDREVVNINTRVVNNSVVSGTALATSKELLV